MQAVKFTLESVAELSTVRLLLPSDLRAPEKRAAVAKNMKEAFRRCASVVDISVTRVDTYALVHLSVEMRSCHLANGD